MYPCAGLSENQKRAYVIADNKLALNAGWDEDALRAELRKLSETDFNVELVGFDTSDLERYLNSGEVAIDAASEWQGMPEFKNEDKTAWRSIYVHFKDQQAMDSFAALVGQKITDSTKYLWYPQADIEKASDKRYGAQE